MPIDIKPVHNIKRGIERNKKAIITHDDVKKATEEYLKRGGKITKLIINETTLITMFGDYSDFYLMEGIL